MKRLSTILPLAAAALHLSAAQAAAPAAIALTVIARAPTDGCYTALDARGRQIVGHTWTDGWRFGINGRVLYFAQRDSSYDNLTGAYTARTRDRAIQVRTVATGSVSNAAADYDILNVEVTVNGAKKLFRGYRFCAPGD